MRPSKRFGNEWADSREAEAGPPKIEPEVEQDESAWAAERRRQARLILSRAAGVYLVLFIGLGLLMSALGINPLANNGLMPKALLLFVGLALVIALAGNLSDLAREQGRGWLRLAHKEEDTQVAKKSGE
ncbi:MAG: hypothetical protein HS126_09050 [Anaerolineales bacterium]|nr:hypothetical protein [Anaerolineales bacterium]